jgi:TetR/AcrR family transcriptional repressor of nem operon
VRYDKTHKQATRTRVLDAAALAIRTDGPDRVGVAGVMAEAGLTHGGFYAHFTSKDNLVAAAITHMFEQGAVRLSSAFGGRDPAEGLARYIDFYLSKPHRDARSSGCPIAALATDLPRMNAASRTAFSRGMQALVAKVAEALSALGHIDSETEAQSLVSELVGALSLSRVETRARQADAILAASRTLIKARFGLETHA